MAMPGRTYASTIGGYRYAHNGQEKDGEIFDGALSAEFWEYDSRLGRRWENDPLVYEWQSPYATFNNCPIAFSDPSGLEGKEGGGNDDKGKGDKKGREPSDKDKADMDEYNKKHDHWEKVWEDGGMVERRKGGGTQSPDAKTNPENTPGSNTPPPDKKDKNPTPNDPVAQNKENNSGGWLNNSINKAKLALSDIANSPLAKQANKFAPTVTGILDQSKKLSERLNGKTRLNRQLAFSNGMRLPKVAVLISSKLGVTMNIPTKIVGSIANIVKPLSRIAAPLGFLATGVQMLVNKRFTAGDVATIAATAAISALGASFILPGAIIWGGLELGSQIFTGKSLSDHANDYYDYVRPKKKTGGIIFEW